MVTNFLHEVITLLLIWFTLFFSSCISNDVPDKFTFDIFRKKSAFEQHLNHGHHFGKTFYKQLHKENRDNDSIALYRFLDDEFYAKIVVGHPGQTFNVVLDTTWSYTWLMSSKCSSIKAIGCYIHNLYDHSKSSEYIPDGRPFNFDAGSFNMTGFYSYENISIAHSNATKQSFIEMVNVPNSMVLQKADGIVGLGLKTDANYQPLFYTLLEQKKIKNPIFSIYLNRDKQSNRGGNVMLGFIDQKHIHKTIINKRPVPDNFTYLRVDAQSYWQFDVDMIVGDGRDKNIVVCEKGCKAIADSSSNSIVGPFADVDKIHDLINAREFFLHRYTIDCETINKLPKIDFILNGKNFTLGGPDYTLKMSWRSITICLSAFQPSYTTQEQHRWLFGGAFLSAFYSVYNTQERTIGFVKAN